jgi:hypothetical protein
MESKVAPIQLGFMNHCHQNFRFDPNAKAKNYKVQF